MITKILMKNVASYKEEAILETNKPINLIYGLNGTGKTQISKFLANPKDENFKECKIEGLNDEKILVYNQDFIDANFYQTDIQKGIFSLSNENAEIKKEIENLEKEISELSVKQKNITKESISKQKQNQEQNDVYANYFWNNVEKKYISDFEIFFEKLKTKKGLYDFLLSRYKIMQNKIFLGEECMEDCSVAISYDPDDEIFISVMGINDEDYNNSMKEIKNRYNAIVDTHIDSIESISQFCINIDNILKIENDSIFQELITGNKNSSIAKLINELNNQDWVKAGFDRYLKDGSDICPFCQQNTLTQDFKNYLKEYFDQKYKEKIDYIEQLKNKYKFFLENIPSEEKFYRKVGNILNGDDINFKKIYADVISNLTDNLQIINEKIETPSKKLELKNSQNIIQDFNEYIIRKQEEITKYNNLLQDRERKKEELKNEFWDLIVKKNVTKICECKNFVDKIDDEIESYKRQESDLLFEIKKAKNNIQDKQKDIINIQEAVDKINDYLKELGILNFYIKVKDSKKQEYIIVREGEDEPSFKTLSEGEKTLISFLYFLQSCQGKEEKDEPTLDKIIVIDDPISSLSFNYIYDMAQLIGLKFFGKDSRFKQIFILTHHLYFFNEIVKISKSKCIKKENNIKSFRVFKNQNNHSCIGVLNNEILNDYQAYWQILKDYKNDEAYKAIIPIAMRNILENFVGFVYKTEVREIINKKIQGSNNNAHYKAFYRYINRESHSDITNISDSKEIDVEMFFDAFKEIFQHLGHEEHYNDMIGEKPNE